MSAPLNWHKWLVLSLLGLALSVRTIGCDKSAITEKFGAEAVARCNEKCPFQNRTGDVHFDLSCGSDCSIEQCSVGCSLWHQGLESSCQNVCNVTSETVFSRELYCVMGCNEALNTYYQKLRDLIGTPPAPALVADSLTATSLSLVWEASSRVNFSYLLQWRFEELPGTWQYYSNTSNTDPFIHVDALQPYTKYRFRVAVFLSGRGFGGGVYAGNAPGAVEPVHSAPSVVISTLERGPPGSPPTALRAAAPGPTRVSISWEPGPFPNGPLISYVLRLLDTHPFSPLDTFILDMPASNNTLFYMFQNLAPAREYEVSVAMRNAVGEGPRAFVIISTPSLPVSVPSQQPILIMGGDKNVLAAPANDILLSDPVELYSTDSEITGVGLDVSHDYLFVSVSTGYVYRSSLSTKSISKAILTPSNISYKPHDLSVDWLNHHLYVLGQVNHTQEGSNWSNSSMVWEIIRYDFDGKNELVALSGFTSRPTHFEVDAYNGYLFWAFRGGKRGGLYRLDLANISNGVRHNAPLELIVKDANLGSFTVDHADFRILVAHLTRNTVLAVSLDGRELTDFRSNTQTPMFLSAQSIAYAIGLFYWTNGKEMLTEEYHEKSNSYFHIEYPLVYNTRRIAIRQVLVSLRSCQPIPVPVNPPIGVQSIMGINRAKVSWSPPHLLGHQGVGAWQQWSFHLQLTHAATGEIVDIKNINGSSYTAVNLKQDSEYIIKVAAVTSSGSGPWSSECVGKSLPLTESTQKSTLIWSGSDGLLQTNLTGDNVKILLDRGNFKDFHITDISWYQDKLYLVTNTSYVMWYNITSMKHGWMSNMDNVGSLAVDWVGKKIYWSNPKQQLITRGNLDGSNREPVPIVTVAKEITIDSMEAYIYWNTGHAVEAARLNGENKTVYYPAQLFSGKQVMGITGDFENKWLYWLVRSYDGSELHKAPTADRLIHGGSDMSKTVVALSGLGADAGSLGPLRQFSGRLVWVAGGGAVLADAAGAHAALLRPAVRALAVVDPTMHALANKLVAIPEPVNSSSIIIVGEWNKFNVTWAPAITVNINNSRVYYDVSVNFPGLNYKVEKTVDVPWVEVGGPWVSPYSACEVTVRAHSAWGGGSAARALAASPPALPAPPAHVRLYLHHAQSGGNGRWVVGRWDAPQDARGPVRGYEPRCWARPAPPAPSACAPHRMPPATTQLLLHPLRANTTYYFQVRAFTDAGFGPYSDVVTISSEDINPIPKVMLSSQESINILDLDSDESVSIPKSAGIPIDFGVSIEENILYWVNNLNEIFSSRINGTGSHKLGSLNGTAQSLCVDWISRSVFWNQREVTPEESYVTYRAELGMYNSRPRITRLFVTKHPVYSLHAVPLKRLLIWYEETEQPKLGRIMAAHIDGSNIRTFFNGSENLKSRENCTCPESPQVSPTFTIDMTKKEYKLFWVDPWVHKITSSDINGCKCSIIFDATEKKRFGFTPKSISVDSKYVYWFNSTEEKIFYTTKHKHSNVEQVKVSHGYKIMALDPENQPYPSKECLFPKQQNIIPKVLSNSATSITLKLPPLAKPDRCRNLQYDMSATEYTVLYRQYKGRESYGCHRDTCNYTSTTDNQIVLNNLKPFTNYTVVLEATNYYALLHEVKPVVGSSLVLQTAAEAPKAPKDVTVTVLSPVSAKVEWTPEPGLWYEVHWTTEDSPTFPQKFKEYNSMNVVGGEVGSAVVSRLAGGARYSVWVRARSPHSPQPADSAALRVRTYPPPARPAPARALPRALLLRWPHPTTYTVYQYKVEYTEANGSQETWKACVPSNSSNDEWMASPLEPATRYRFRLCLQYVPSAPLYYWTDEHFVFTTLSDVPGPPGEVVVESVGERVVRVWWREAAPRGAPVTHYRLWGRPQRSDEVDTAKRNTSEERLKTLPDDIDDDMKKLVLEEGWQLLHNALQSYWVVSADAVEVSGAWWGRVQARNALGWGAVGPAAPLAAPPPRAPRAPAPAALLAAALAALLVLALLLAAALLYAYNNRNKKKKALESAAARRGPDLELASLRQLPIRHSTNILYNQGVHCPSDAEVAALPRISRDQITLTKFLGSGAFGEVFEGTALHLQPGNTTTKVAVKTLRKGASEQEKCEFVKEAALMSNFKHEHILRLLGVCLENDPAYIIMELMEGGDLLTYLREKRTALYTNESLTLVDLLNICVDVSKGCRYLEEMHYVHRDLAARNCLVANRAGVRIVKIGDFGLARDIYKNDYYRKEGEGLLPVRWMAVECLIDGVFSCQSDVWAWGVLCWEVLSLGQQPYPARTNREVLAYVRNGGKPSRPPNCPQPFYSLLQRCWSYRPEDRPSFRECLAGVRALRDATPAQPLPHPHYLQLLADETDAVDNRTYLLDENDNTCLDEEYPEQMEVSGVCVSRVAGGAGGAGGAGDGYEVPVAARARARRSQSARGRPRSATIVPLRTATHRASLNERFHAPILL